MTATRSNLTATGCLLVCVLLWSTIPLLLTFGVGAAPALFIAMNRFTGGATNIGYLFIAYPRLRTSPGAFIRTLYPKGERRKHAQVNGLVATGKLEWVSYIVALSLASPHIVIMIVETWPAVMVIGLIVLNLNTGRYRRTGTLTKLAVLGTIAGGVLIAAPGGGPGTAGMQFLGVGMAALTSLLAGGHHALIVRWGDRAAERLREAGLERSLTRARVFGCIWMQCTSQWTCATVILAVGLILGETPTRGEILAAMALAVVSSGASDIFFRTGTAMATTTAVTMVVYLTPVMSLTWLSLISGLNVQNFALTAVGIAAIIGGNGMIAVDGARHREPAPEPRPATAALHDK